MHRRLGSATLSQVVSPGEGDFSIGEIALGNTVVKKLYKKKSPLKSKIGPPLEEWWYCPSRLFLSPEPGTLESFSRCHRARVPFLLVAHWPVSTIVFSHMNVYESFRVSMLCLARRVQDNAIEMMILFSVSFYLILLTAL